MYDWNTHCGGRNSLERDIPSQKKFYLVQHQLQTVRKATVNGFPVSFDPSSLLRSLLTFLLQSLERSREPDRDLGMQSGILLYEGISCLNMGFSLWNMNFSCILSLMHVGEITTTLSKSDLCIDPHFVCTNFA